ncbi:DUF3786 domain-containing protein [Candidatus Bipolaricaulota bacterium]|nr:DUF3786 domain-containing protein [Candidatus Bipolaricaulota bacterium]
MGSSLIKRKNEIRHALLSADPEVLAARSGSHLEDDELHLSVLGDNYTVSLTDCEIRSPEGKPPEELEVIILDYILGASPADKSGDWIAFREIPNGNFYSTNFKSNTETKLTREFQRDIERFEEVAEQLGGTPITLGDSGFSFQVMPKFDMALVFWDGGEEFQDRINVLFESSAPDCLPTEGLSMLGKKLCNKILAKAEGK